MNLDHTYLKYVLDYNSENGVFTWKVKVAPNIKIGNIAGCITSFGYWHIKLKGKLYLAHRLACFYMTGKWPENEIDHKDLNKLNNKWENLREATHSQNQQNQKEYSNNKCGVKGIYWCKRANKWIARIQFNNTRKIIGNFVTKEEAQFAVEAAYIKYHGKFARILNA